MADPLVYPHGDVQTWVEGTAEDLIDKVPAEIAKIVAKGAGTAHAFNWRRSMREVMRLQAMMVGGTIPIDETIGQEKPQPRMRDCGSGMAYAPTEPLTFDPATIGGEENELLRGGTLRLLLQKNLDTVAINAHARLIVERDPAVMSAPIAEYEASTLDECRAVLGEIEQLLIKRAGAKRLWLRGQLCEYPYPRSSEIKDWLRLGKDDADVPSLVPSLGRYALKNPGKIDFGYAFAGPNHWWKKPFLIWVTRQNPRWLDHYPAFVQRLDESLTSTDDTLFSRLLVDIQMDPRVPDEVDDLRQWFFAHYKYSAWVWVLQQYGYLASMLDITWDLDTALFFAQARMIDGRFTLPDPTDDRLIYVFAEAHDSPNFWDTDSIDWGDSDWARRLPPRIVSQRAGCLTGSTWFRQNYYGYLVLARIRLTGTQCLTTRTVEEVFPWPDTDLLLRTLLDANPRPEGLYW